MSTDKIMLARSSNSTNDRSDDVQQTLDILDRVLAQYDDNDLYFVNGGSPEQFPLLNPSNEEEIASTKNNCVTEDRSPSGIGGHQSEDDGYMSMNGRKIKLSLTCSSPSSCDITSADENQSIPESKETRDFPPPPEEAERIISALFPKVSPSCTATRNANEIERECKKDFKNLIKTHFSSNLANAAQTTLPLTKHHNGWQRAAVSVSSHDQLSSNGSKYSSLPNQRDIIRLSPEPLLSEQAISAHVSCSNPSKLTVSSSKTPFEFVGVLNCDIGNDDTDAFSDDSLEILVGSSETTHSKQHNYQWEAEECSQPWKYRTSKGFIDYDWGRDSSFTNTASSDPENTTLDSSSYVSSPKYSISPLDGNLWNELTTGDCIEIEDCLDGETSYVHHRKKCNFDSGTFIIRKRHKIRETPSPALSIIDQDMISSQCSNEGRLKRSSSTFDNIKVLLEHGLIEGLNDSPPDFQPPLPPLLSRGFSLPSLLNDRKLCENMSKSKGYSLRPSVNCSSSRNYNESDSAAANCISICIGAKCNQIELSEKQSVAIQVSGDFTSLNGNLISEDNTSSQTDNYELNLCVAKAMDTAESITSTGTFKRHVDAGIIEATPYDEPDAVHKKALHTIECESHSQIIDQEQIAIDEKRSSLQGKQFVQESCLKPPCGFEEKFHDFCLENNEEPLISHQFGPLPPSPVEEVDDEFLDVIETEVTAHGRALGHSPNINDTSSVDCSRKGNPDLPVFPPISSLRTRSIDAGFIRNHGRSQCLSSRREVPPGRRTLPTEAAGPSNRFPFFKRASSNSSKEHVSCSLPETPIFARGCDVARTSTIMCSNSPMLTERKQAINGLQTSCYNMRNIGAGRGSGLSEALAGAELLSLSGPGRGWYPRQRHQRPTSVEHLDRLPSHQSSNPSTPSTAAWETRETRKPFTLPPNLSPKFFQRSPREALRRVTSLLIRKGVNSKDSKSKDVLTSSVIGPYGDFGETTRSHRPKKGFFRAFWKRSRQYSLDQLQ